MSLLDQLQSYIVLALSVGALGVEAWAVIDCVRRPSTAFEAAGKRTKGFWLAVTIVAALLGGQQAGELLADRAEDPNASAEPYEQHLASVLARYRDERRTAYALEQRWPDSPFWQRRNTDGLPS